MNVLDLFSAAAGGWSLGMHRAGFRTVAACERVAWRRALYAQNNPGVILYDDVCTLTADRIVSDLGYLPSVVVGSPPCQDISPANTKGKGVEGERSGLYFEAVRIIGEVRPRWFALENSSNLRTRGADAVLAALEALGYTCWSFVVGADLFTDSPHERKRSWLIGCDLEQVADADGLGWDAGRQGRRGGLDISVSDDPVDATRLGHEGGRSWGHGPDGDGAAPVAQGDASYSNGGKFRQQPRGWGGKDRPCSPLDGFHDPQFDTGNPPDADEAGQEAGLLESSLRPSQEPDDGCGDGRRDDGPGSGQMGGSESLGPDFEEPWAGWNGGLAGHLRMDDGLSPWVAKSRIAVGGPRGTVAASLIVEAFGDSVLPQIPEAIGRAILRTEAALSAIYGRAAA